MSSIDGSEIAPGGVLRAGINFGNTVLVRRDDQGNPKGIAADLARALAERLHVSLQFVTYDAAGFMADGVKTGAWDVAFLAIDPKRAEAIAFTPPYLEIDSTYLVPEDSRFQTVVDVDRDSVRIALSRNSAYDLFLTRQLRHAVLERADGPAASVDLFFRNRLDALAGIRPMLEDVARLHPGTRILDGRFTAVAQAIGIPKNRQAALAHVRKFLEDIKTSGFLDDVIRRSGVTGVTAVP